MGINQQSKLHAARLASCRFTIGAIKFSVLSRELVVDTYAGERPSQFSPPFSPFELVHCCIEKYLCVARVQSPSQDPPTWWASVRWVTISYVYRAHTLCRKRNLCCNLCHAIYISYAVSYTYLAQRSRLRLRPPA